MPANSTGFAAAFTAVRRFFFFSVQHYSLEECLEQLLKTVMHIHASCRILFSLVVGLVLKAD